MTTDPCPICRLKLGKADLMDTAGKGEVAMWEAQKASNTRLDYGAKVCCGRGQL